MSWGGPSQLAMLLRGLRHALTGEFDWLVLLSGQDYPLRPLADDRARSARRAGSTGSSRAFVVPPPPG